MEGKCSEKRDAHAEMLLCALNLCEIFRFEDDFEDEI